MQYIIFILAILYYIYRFVQNQKKEQEQAARRRQQTPPAPGAEVVPPPTADNQSRPKTIEEILAEMQRRVETQTKPFARPAKQQPHKPKPLVKKEAPKSELQKEPVPFLSVEDTFYQQEVKRNKEESEFIKRGELKDVYDVAAKKPVLAKNFNLRDAVIASIILNRPDY